MLIVLGVASTVGFNFHVILPVLASDTLDAGPEVFGALSACFGGGALLGALIQAARGKASWVGLLAGATGFSAGLVVLAPMQTAALAGAVLFAVGVCFTIWVANTSALLQLRAPDRLRGRVMSLFMFAFAGLAPIGGLWAGWVMDVGGTQLALTIGGAVSLVRVRSALRVGQERARPGRCERRGAAGAAVSRARSAKKSRDCATRTRGARLRRRGRA